MDKLCPSSTTDPTSHPVLPSLLPVGAVDFPSEASEGERETLEGAVFRLRERISQRRVLVKPCFQDFDRYASELLYSCRGAGGVIVL